MGYACIKFKDGRSYNVHNTEYVLLEEVMRLAGVNRDDYTFEISPKPLTTKKKAALGVIDVGCFYYKLHADAGKTHGISIMSAFRKMYAKVAKATTTLIHTGFTVRPGEPSLNQSILWFNGIQIDILDIIERNDAVIEFCKRLNGGAYHEYLRSALREVRWYRSDRAVAGGGHDELWYNNSTGPSSGLPPDQAYRWFLRSSQRDTAPSV